MASDRSSSRNQPRRQSIPLQDLSRPPDLTINDNARGHSRSFSGRARELLSNRQSFGGRGNTAYERVDEGSPPAGERNLLNLPHVTTPRIVHQPPYNYEDGEVSPVNAEDFQVAMGSVGLSFGDSGVLNRPAISGGSSKRGSTLDIIAEREDVPSFFNPVQPLPNDNDNEAYFSPTDDSTPLTDARYLQPISGAQASSSSGQRHDRQNSAFSFQERHSPGSRLGDDLPNAEAGLHRSGSRAFQRLSSQSMRSPNRSLSVSATTSPLSRAGSIVRKMSQRVVNLSNEPEVVEQSIRRQPSIKQARLEAPPSFPAMAEYAHDEPSRTPQIEKASQLVYARPADGRRQNPLKGKSLLFFAPDNWLRLKLCDMLVHPATEPAILVFIVAQTILLAVDAAPALKYGERPKVWTGSAIDIVLLILFSIYTLEIIAKIIVSGLIKNPYEHSTVNWSLGFKNAITELSRSFFAGNKQSSVKNSSGASDPQPSILRSFTGAQGLADIPGNSRDQQAFRLARRAFLRHSFNRLDLLAVVSFWVSFALSLSLVEENRHIYVLRMLSCLRILRLLSLTSGTSVINTPRHCC